MGESTAAGPQAPEFSAGPKGGNRTRDKRKLRTTRLRPDAPADTLDTTESH